jgi:hypothetical protein
VSKRRFSDAERLAIWKAHKRRCFYCDRPIEWDELAIDHIVPERLLDRAEELSKLIADYQIETAFPDFQINGHGNLVPAHQRPCNSRKAGDVFAKSTTLFYLDRVKAGMAAIEKALASFNHRRFRDNVFGYVSTAIDNRCISTKELKKVAALKEQEQHADEPLVLAFYTSDEAINEFEAVPEYVINEYAHVCDWLELDLVRHLRAIVSTPFHYTEPSGRTGESLSVRIVFPRLCDEELDCFDRPWWEIVEEINFWQLYRMPYAKAYPEPPSQEYFGELPGDDDKKGAILN